MPDLFAFEPHFAKPKLTKAEGETYNSPAAIMFPIVVEKVKF